MGLVVIFSFLDKHYFLYPIEYEREIVVRCDRRGNGFFGAPRSSRQHQGIDLYAPVGKPVRAARLGRVITSQRNRGMGNYVILRHSGNLITIYGHLSEIYVKKGQFVRQGEVIGLVGKSGNVKFSRC
ncbi:MAG: M23 family metallopeptidase [Candidatus Omnitrophica bacterium]|nr:M23 family metallopeptidase [Candidatus Omnitrophota bacterium]